MDLIKNYLTIEGKRFNRKWNRVIVLLLFLICLCLLQYAIVQYNDIRKGQSKFLEFEQKKVLMYTNYMQYGTYGFQILFFPHPNFIFFRDSLDLPEIKAWADSGERLKIEHLLIGSNIFNLKKFRIADFNGVILVLGSLFGLLFGYEAFQSVRYYHFLSTLITPLRLFLLQLLSRVLILFFLLLALMGLALLVVGLNGLPVPWKFLLLDFFPQAFGLIVFFLGMGVACGNMRKKAAGLVVGIASWVLLLFLFPAFLAFVTGAKANNINPLYKLELDKLRLVMNFEKKAIDEAGLFNKENVKDVDKKLILSYYRSEFLKLHDMEVRMRADMKKHIGLYHLMSMFVPTTHFSAVTSELSSSSLLNLIQFYQYTQEKKEAFFVFYMNKLFFSPPSVNQPPLENFVKGNENLFFAKSLKPWTTYWGLGLTLLYFFFLLYLGYRGLLRNFTRLSEYEKKKAKGDIFHLNITKGAFQALQLNNELIPPYLHDYFGPGVSPRATQNMDLAITFDNKPLPAKGYKMSMVFLDSPDILPGDIQAKDFVQQICLLLNYSKTEQNQLVFRTVLPHHLQQRIEDLTQEQKAELLSVALAYPKRQLYIIADLFYKLPGEFICWLTNRLNHLAQQGPTVVLLSKESVSDITRRSNNPAAIGLISQWNPVIQGFEDELRLQAEKKTSPIPAEE